MAEVTDRFASTGGIERIFSREELNAKEVYRFSEQDWINIHKLVSDKFYTFDWIYGKSPLTIIKKNGMEIEVESGRINQITNSKLQIPDVKGARYEFEELKEKMGEENARLIM